MEEAGFAAVEYGAAMGVASLAVALGGLLSGGLVDALGPAAAATLGWSISAAASLLFVYAPEASLAALLAWRVASVLPYAAPQVMIARRHHDSRATALAVLSTAERLAALPGPALVGAAASLSPTLPFMARALLLPASAMLLYAASRRSG